MPIGINPIAYLQGIIRDFSSNEATRLERAERLTLAARETSRIEALQFLARQKDGTANLTDLLDTMSAFRSTATLHVARMVQEGQLVAVPEMGGQRIPPNVVISLPPTQETRTCA